MSANGRDGHITAYPLCWPFGWERIPPHERVPRFAGADHSQGWDGVTQRLFDQLRLLDATDIIPLHEPAITPRWPPLCSEEEPTGLRILV